jgi:hypothetical protein
MKTLSLALLALFSLPAVAAESVAPDAVLSAVTIDFNNDGGFDRAVLAEVTGPDGSTGETDLYVYLSVPNELGRDQRRLELVKHGAAWAGGMWGTLPSLEVSRSGSLLLKSGNDAIGRGRWEQTLTIAYRNNELTVVGLTYTSRDTLDPNGGGNCDLNLLTGKGTRNGKKIKASIKASSLKDWNTEELPKECQFE